MFGCGVLRSRATDSAALAGTKHRCAAVALCGFALDSRLRLPPVFFFLAVMLVRPLFVTFLLLLAVELLVAELTSLPSAWKKTVRGYLPESFMCTASAPELVIVRVLAVSLGVLGEVASDALVLDEMAPEDLEELARDARVLAVEVGGSGARKADFSVISFSFACFAAMANVLLVPETEAIAVIVNMVVAQDPRCSLSLSLLFSVGRRWSPELSEVCAAREKKQQQKMARNR
jgi:hypothetical protein